jgi:hypothetical protein
MIKTGKFLIVVTLLVASAAASTDPFVGKWVLNVQRSKYPAGACPKRMIIEMNTVGRGIHYRSDAIYENGSETRAEYTAEYNGKQAIVMGTHAMLLPVFLKRIDSRTVVASYTKTLQVVARSRRIVSTDGQLMTITTTSKDKSGKNVTTIGLYERQ